jgi:hypothetical protein
MGLKGYSGFSRVIVRNIEHLCTNDEAHQFEELYFSLQATVDAELNLHDDTMTAHPYLLMTLLHSL